MRIMSIAGARPQFVKLAPLDRELRSRGIEHIIVHSGQHYDKGMSTSFFDELGIATPKYELEVGSSSHGKQTARILESCEEVISIERPDWCVAIGDTNTALGSALAAAKLNIPLAHLEAGLRGANRRIPEEVNRIVVDHLSDLLLAPTESAVNWLAREGLSARTILVGDIMAQLALETAERVGQEDFRPPWIPHESFVFATLHRPYHVDTCSVLDSYWSALSSLPLPVLVPVHPRLKKGLKEAGLAADMGSIVPLEPLTYRETISALLHCSSVVTDSGGLQKEAYILRRTCTSIRNQQEWPETLESGWNIMTKDPAAIEALALRKPPRSAPKYDFGGRGVARLVCDALMETIPETHEP